MTGPPAGAPVPTNSRLWLGISVGVGLEGVVVLLVLIVKWLAAALGHG